MHVHGFLPIANPDARVLVLGTMPSKVSLREQQYYAHPQNKLWRIVGGILGFDADAVYDVRVSSLTAAGIALWDVLKTCTRASSLDSDIEPDSIVPNDFQAFFAAHPRIRKVCFNGAKAEQLYMQHVRPLLPMPIAPVEYVRLPSTSPANAGTPLAKKLRAWQVIAPDA